MRLDRRLRELSPQLSWTRIRQSIARGQVLVDGRVAREPALEVGADATIVVDLNRPGRRTARLDLPRLYEDDDILVVDKPAGLLTIPSHPSRRASEDTVLRRVREYMTHLRGPGGYVGTLHRLDRDTSGALAMALSRPAHEAGRRMFAEHAFERVYLALVEGHLADASGTISAPISNTYVSGRRRIAPESDGLPAVTHYRTLEAFDGASFLELRLETGRQHQIRAHLEHVGHPLVGERVYSAGQRGVIRAARPMLHAWKLAFPHPLHGDAISTEARLPGDFEKLLARLR